MVGFFRYVRWAPEHARAELAYVLARSRSGRGLATGAVREIIRFGFENMALYRVEARCAAENLASARVMQKAGMTHEATLKGRESWKGRFWDMEVYCGTLTCPGALNPHAQPGCRLQCPGGTEGAAVENGFLFKGREDVHGLHDRRGVPRPLLVRS